MAEIWQIPRDEWVASQLDPTMSHSAEYVGVNTAICRKTHACAVLTAIRDGHRPDKLAVIQAARVYCHWDMDYPPEVLEAYPEIRPLARQLSRFQNGN